MIFSIFRFFCTLRFQIYKYCPIITNHTSMERLFIQLPDDPFTKLTLMTGFVLLGHIYCKSNSSEYIVVLSNMKMNPVEPRHFSRVSYSRCFKTSNRLWGRASPERNNESEVKTREALLRSRRVTVFYHLRERLLQKIRSSSYSTHKSHGYSKQYETPSPLNISKILWCAPHWTALLPRLIAFMSL